MPVKDERGGLDVSKAVKPVQATLSSLKMLDVGKWPIFSLCSEEELQLVRQACVFGSAGNEVLYTTVNDEIFVLGTNCCGCLGLGDVQSTIEPRRLDSLSGKKNCLPQLWEWSTCCPCNSRRRSLYLGSQWLQSAGQWDN